jgi:hypothetical protein
VTAIELATCAVAFEAARFAIRCPDGNANAPLVAPLDLLTPADELEAEEGDVVSSFRWSDTATRFPIDRTTIAFHLSSYDIQPEGSMQAAAGRDVFLVSDPGSQTLRTAGPKLGVTKERARTDGCMHALHHTFELGDVDGDGRLDLGIRREELRCVSVPAKQEPGEWLQAGPCEDARPVEWHRWNGGDWEAVRGASAPRESVALPLVGLVKSPVAFVKEMTRRPIPRCPEESRR